MKIKSLHLEQFKGVADATYQFGDLTKISGQNGSGKTTIADAIYFILLGKNYQLKDNPEIKNINMEESIPIVTMVMDLNGKDVVVSKKQKTKKSKPDENGVIKVTSTNTYTWNDVPVTERDFKQKFKDEGIELDLFAELSHPDVFTKGLGDKKQKDHNRETLFKMCDSHSDKDIAGMYEDTRALVDLLDKYTIQEIEAMNKASLKKAKEEVESIPFQIVGMEKSKTDDSMASELELQKNALEKKLSEIGSNLELSELNQKVMQLEFDKNEYVRQCNAKLIQKRNDFENEIATLDMHLKKLSSDKIIADGRIKDLEQAANKNDLLVKDLQRKWTELTASKFNQVFNPSDYDVKPSEKNCKACGQLLPEERIAEIVANAEKRKADAKAQYEKSKEWFEKSKQESLDKVVAEGKQASINRDNAKKEIEKWFAESQKIEKDIESARTSIEKLKKDLYALPEKEDLSKDETYQGYIADIEQLNEEINQKEGNQVDIEAEKDKVAAELEDVRNKIAAIANNVEIDKRIADLRDKQLDLEQAKANAERVLYQLEQLNMKKNTLCEESINNHFEYVKFKLFQYLKNGSTVDCCIPTIEGKAFQESMNTGLEMIAKLDICSSLQKFYGINIPIILDNAESINDYNLPKLDCQLIELRVTEDKELTVR